MRKEKISIGKVDASREREFLEKYNLLGDNLLGGIEQEHEHEQIGEYKNTAGVMSLTIKYIRLEYTIF